METKRGKGRFGNRQPAVGIAKVGVINLNPAVYNLLGESKYVDLHYHDDTIVITPSDDPEFSYELKPTTRGMQYRINSRSFIRSNNIRPGTYSAEVEDDRVVVKV